MILDKPRPLTWLSNHDWANIVKASLASHGATSGNLTEVKGKRTIQRTPGGFSIIFSVSKHGV